MRRPGTRSEMAVHRLRQSPNRVDSGRSAITPALRHSRPAPWLLSLPRYWGRARGADFSDARSVSDGRASRGQTDMGPRFTIGLRSSGWREGNGQEAHRTKKAGAGQGGLIEGRRSAR
jgi:hypothetical protein